jgi:hypothetical protein
MTLADLRHPNVLQFLGASMKPPHLAMVTEHMPFSLHHVLYQAGIDLDRKKVVGLAQDISRCAAARVRAPYEYGYGSEGAEVKHRSTP